MVQAKLISLKKECCNLALPLNFFISRTIRVIILVRVVQANIGFLSSVAKVLLKFRLIEISTTVIGKNFFLPHPQCIIIASGVKIGEYVHVGQYVTIGGNFKKTKTLIDGKTQKLPIIGDRVMILPGAVIGGPVSIGDDVIIGANSVITKDVPSNTIAYGQNQFAEKKIRIPSEGDKFEVIELK